MNGAGTKNHSKVNGTGTNESSDLFGERGQSISGSETPTRSTTVSGWIHFVQRLKGCGMYNMVHAVEG